MIVKNSQWIQAEKSPKGVCIVSPFPPPYGGMAIQAQKFVSLLKGSGYRVIPVRTNANFPKYMTFLARIKGVRTLISLLLCLNNLNRALHQVELVYFLTGFFNFFFWVTYPALVLIKLRRKKVILSAHGGAAKLFLEKYGLFLKPILKRVDIFTTPSGFLADAFKKVLNIEAQIIPNIIGLDQFRFRERRFFRPKLLVTRSLEKIYNVETVIKAFKIVNDYFSESTLGIVGDGSDREKLKKLASRLGLSNCIKFYGRVNNADIQKIYEEYDIFVNASNVDNLPISILEAFACGLPVVSTNAGGIPYLVENEVTGLLVEMEDFKGLANKVTKLVEDQKLSYRLCRNARKECAKYSQEYVKSLLIPLLANIQMSS